MKKYLFFTIILTLVISFTTIAGATENGYSLQGETFTVYTADGLMVVAAKINADTAYAGYAEWKERKNDGVHNATDKETTE